MSIRRIFKLLAFWVVSRTITGTTLGFIMGLGDTGHIAHGIVVLMLLIAGAIFGIFSGVLLIPLYIKLAPRFNSEEFSLCVAVLLGTLSGVLGIYPVDKLMNIKSAFAFGSIAGSIGGLILGIIETRHRRNLAANK